MSIKLIATCPDCTKETVADELSELGATNISLGYMAVYFEATEEDFYKIHLKCSTASQILMILRESAAPDPKILFSQAKRVNWSSVFDSKKTYRIDVNSNEKNDKVPQGMKTNDISKIIRSSVEYVFDLKGENIPKVDLKEPDVIISAYVYGGRMTISIVTSGLTLHKRGYRVEGHPAPLKETLAATLLKLAEYDGSETVLDPMSGSGTIGIEAATMGLKKACNIHRKKGVFAFECLAMFDKDLWRKIQDDVRKEKLEELPGSVYVSDIEDKYVELAKSNALRARVEKHMTFTTKSFFDMEKPTETGLIVCNLPYGERIEGSKGGESISDMGSFYKSVGNSLKKNFHGWRVGLLCAEDTPWKAIGLKPSRKYNLLNGSIKTKFLIFEMRKGSFRD